MKRSLSLFAIIFVAVFASRSFSAQKMPVPLWNEGGIVVNDAYGNTVQQSPKIAKLNYYQYLMVWEDFRSGYSDLYIQRLDGEGNRLLEKDGNPICDARDEQLYPQIVPDGQGNAFLAWQDNRSGNFDIYLQKMDANGSPFFLANGIPVCTAGNGQVFPEMTSDGQGGVIVVWQDYRAKEEDVYAQRIDAQGKILWELDGIPVCTEKGTQWFPKVAADGYGGAYIVWTDRRGEDLDIYGQHLDPYGKPLWGKNGIPVCQLPQNQENPKIIANGLDGAYVAWTDSRANDSGVYVQYMSFIGQKLFKDQGVKVSNTFLGPSNPDIISDNERGLIVTWSDPSAGDSDIYAQRVNVDGKILWGEEPKPIVQLRGVQERPKIYRGGALFYILWEDQRRAGKQIYMQAVDKNGFLYYGSEGLLVASDQRSAQSFDTAIDDDRSAIVCYQDNKKGNFDVYAQKISERGSLSWGAYGKLVNNTLGSVSQQNFKAASDNRSNLYFAFEDKRSGYSNIFIQKLNSEGYLLWNYDGMGAATALSEQLNPDICEDEKGGAFVVWEDYRNSAGSKIYAQHFNSQGEPQIKGGLVLTPKVSAFNQKKPTIIPDGENGAIVIFVDTRLGINGSDIYAQRISSSGKLLWGGEGSVITQGNGNQEDPVIAPTSLIISWTDYRNGERNSDIYAQRLDLSGNRLWEEDGVPICEAPDSQRDPAIVDDWNGGAIISWTDKGGGNFDIYSQRINGGGSILWLKDGVPVCQTARTQQRPKIVSASGGESFIVWEDFRYGNWDIVGQSLSSQGRIGASEEGIAICSSYGTQYNPDLICLNGYNVVAWEDYRSGSAYNIYLQAFNPEKNQIWPKDGFLVIGTNFGARAPKLVNAGLRQFVIAWEDLRNGGRSINAQKFKF